MDRKEELTLIKKLDSYIIRLDNHLIITLLFKFYCGLNEIFPEYKRKYFGVAYNKGLISEEQIGEVKEWRDYRNKLVHNNIRLSDEDCKKIELIKNDIETIINQVDEKTSFSYDKGFLQNRL